MSKPVSDDVQRLLGIIMTHCDDEDSSVRQRQLRQWKQLKLFWQGFQNTWYSEVAHDWRIADEALSEDNTAQGVYDKPVNIFRAYLESIIAALSIMVPPVKCYPDDADNTLDLMTAKGGDKIANLLYRHNDAPLLFVHALFIFVTEGLIAARVQAKSDDSYGTYEKKTYREDDEEHTIVRCPECGFDINDEVTQGLTSKVNQLKDEVMPENVGVQDYVQNTPEQELCPSCLQMIDPMIVKENFVVTRLIGVTTEPKTRICMEAFGGLNVKVPNYARNQKECPYLLCSHEIHYADAMAQYGDLDGSKLKKSIAANIGILNPYEAWARLSPQYNGEYPNNVVTIREGWIRPSMFNILTDDEDTKKLSKLFPNGCKVVFVNDQFAEACDECLDDVWTLTQNPLSDFVHFDPLGLLLVSVQELINDLISLTIQTVEHGIGQTFADPGVIDFEAYRQLEATPGGMYEATPKSGKSLNDAFYQAKTATLSGEVLPFMEQLQALAQLVSGALPSLFGGNLGGGGETASQYSMSRSQALQRLQNTWKMLTAWWRQIFGKAIPLFIKEVKDDERDVQRTADGSFINVFIRKAELEGKIGKVEIEANENLPITWSQRQEVIMKLLQTGTPEILAILGAPENLPVIKDAIGLENFFVPGEDDREKALDDIQTLLNSTSIHNPEDGTEMPSVEVDPIFDNPDIAFEIVRKWVIGEAGRQTKLDNPEGYRNVLLYGQQLKMLQMQQMAPLGNGAAPNEKPKEDTQTPITGESNVNPQA